MPQEGLELCDGVDAVPNPGTGTGPTALSFLFAHPLPLWSLPEEEWGHFFVPSPPRHSFSAVPYCRYEKPLTWGQCYAQALANTPRFCPPGATSESLSPSPAAPWCS